MDVYRTIAKKARCRHGEIPVGHTIPYYGVVQKVDCCRRNEAGALVCTAKSCQQCTRARDRVTRGRST